MTDSLILLKALTEKVHPLTNEEWIAFASVWKPLTARRKELLTAAGERENYLYFILDGVQRVYYYDEQDREATLVFTYPPSFGGVLDSMLLDQKSKYNYETLTKSTFLRAQFSEIRELSFRHSGINQMVMKGMSGALSGLLERLAELQAFSSEEKFRKLFNRSPHILQIVPHKYLANYLGIDPTNFSKLINKVII